MDCYVWYEVGAEDHSPYWNIQWFTDDVLKDHASFLCYNNTFAINQMTMCMWFWFFNFFHYSIFSFANTTLFNNVAFELVKVLVAQLCLSLCDLIDYNPPKSSVYGISRQEYWSGFPFPSPGNLPDPGIDLRSPTLRADFLPSELPGKPFTVIWFLLIFIFLKYFLALIDHLLHKHLQHLVHFHKLFIFIWN